MIYIYLFGPLYFLFGEVMAGPGSLDYDIHNFEQMKDVQGMSDIVKRSREYTIEAIQGLPLDEHSAEKIKKLMEAQNKKIEDVQQRYYGEYAAANQKIKGVKERIKLIEEEQKINTDKIGDFDDEIVRIQTNEIDVIDIAMSTIEDDLLDKKKEISSEKDQIDAENISLIGETDKTKINAAKIRLSNLNKSKSGYENDLRKLEANLQKKQNEKQSWKDKQEKLRDKIQDVKQANRELTKQNSEIIQQKGEFEAKKKLEGSKYQGTQTQINALIKDINTSNRGYQDVLGIGSLLLFMPKEFTKDVHGIGYKSNKKAKLEDVSEDFFKGNVWPGTVFSVEVIKPENASYKPTINPATGDLMFSGKLIPPKDYQVKIKATVPIQGGGNTSLSKKYNLNFYRKTKVDSEKKPLYKEAYEKINTPLAKKRRSRTAHALAGGLVATKGSGVALGVTGLSAAYSVGSSLGVYKGIIKESAAKGRLGYIWHLPTEGIKRTILNLGPQVASNLYNNTRRGAKNFYGGGLKRLVKGESFRENIIPDATTYLKTSFGR